MRELVVECVAGGRYEAWETCIYDGPIGQGPTEAQALADLCRQLWPELKWPAPPSSDATEAVWNP